MPRAAFSAVAAVSLLFAPFAAFTQQTQASPPPLGTASFTPPESKEKEPLTPEVFAVRASIVNLSEIELSELVLEKSANPDLRQYAAQLIRDHKTAQARLRQIAATAKVALPGTVDEPSRELKEKLAEQTGVEFDRDYVRMTHAGHDKAGTLFEAAAAAPQLDATFKSYAREALRTVQSHGNQADKLLSQLEH
jgi:putative membrane protein